MERVMSEGMAWESLSSASAPPDKAKSDTPADPRRTATLRDRAMMLYSPALRH